MIRTELVLPEDFANYSWEVESKGVFWDAVIQRGERRVAVTFYDPTRLTQDVNEELASENEVLLSHVIVLTKVTLAEMERSVANLPDEFFSPQPPA